MPPVMSTPAIDDSTVRRPWRARPWSHWITFGFCASHIFPTVLLDAQIVLPAIPAWIPGAAVLDRARTWALRQYLTGPIVDPLVRAAARGELPWFRTFLWAELVFQLPVFVVACYHLWHDRVHSIRDLLVVYGAHTATTMVPVLTYLATVAGITTAQRGALLAMYAPYLAVPVQIVVWFGFRWHREVQAKHAYIKAIDEDKAKKRS
ncbi:hypothetical protein GGF32_004149 [Allomyces javanicus]|nr:hypothetical protein GGF32_004149 [Allomyces javanicus]